MEQWASLEAEMAAELEGAPSLTFQDGRPDVLAALKSLTAPGRRACVFVCGPEALVRSSSEAALETGADFHAETFEL